MGVADRKFGAGSQLLISRWGPTVNFLYNHKKPQDRLGAFFVMITISTTLFSPMRLILAAIALSLLTFFSPVAFGKVGPDLSAGVNVAFFTKLRMDYAKAPMTDYFPMWNLAPEWEEIVKAYKDGEVDKVLELADAWLKKCPVDADTHLRVAMCFKEKGDFPSYNYHLGVFYGLLQSITSEGDGKSPETAFKVISIREEYSLLQEVGATVTKQSLVDGNCDKMDITRREGEVKMSVYFDVSIPLKVLASKIESKTP